MRQSKHSRLLGLVWALVLCWIVLPAQAQQLPAFADLVREQSASVVRIDARSERAESQSTTDPRSQQMPDFFREFFGDQLQPRPQNQQPQRSQGSGFIISEDGFIVTNHHVIANATEIRVRTSDHRIFRAELIGTDEPSDVALLKIEAAGLPAVRIGDSDALSVGDWVLAIGAPFGMDYSVTAGIVSAKGRSLGERYVPFIQSDVAINPGNSGGPLFNIDGEVIGINSQIYTRSGGFMGLSFSIPVALVMDIVAQLQDTGQVQRGWLGIAMDDRYNDDPDLAESLGIDRAVGALVAQVYDDTPARAGGLLPGDLILQYDGRDIIRFSDLAPLVGATRPGSAAELTILRNGQKQQLIIQISALPTDGGMQLGQARPQPKPVDPENPLSVLVRDLNADQQRTLPDGGVEVVEVFAGPAQEAGLRAGDIITMIHGAFVTSAEDFQQKMDRLPSNRRIALRIVRDGTTRFISMAVP